MLKYAKTINSASDEGGTDGRNLPDAELMLNFSPKTAQNVKSGGTDVLEVSEENVKDIHTWQPSRQALFSFITEKEYGAAALRIAKQKRRSDKKRGGAGGIEYRAPVAFHLAHFLKLHPALNRLTHEEVIRRTDLELGEIQELHFMEIWETVEFRQIPERFLPEFAGELTKEHPLVIHNRFPNYAAFLSTCAYLQALRKNEPIYIPVNSSTWNDRIFNSKTTVQRVRRRAELHGFLKKVADSQDGIAARFLFDFEKLFAGEKKRWKDCT